MLALSLFVICTEIHTVEKQLTDACEAAGVDSRLAAKARTWG